MTLLTQVDEEYESGIDELTRVITRRGFREGVICGLDDALTFLFCQRA